MTAPDEIERTVKLLQVTHVNELEPSACNTARTANPAGLGLTRIGARSSIIGADQFTVLGLQRCNAKLATYTDTQRELQENLWHPFVA